MRVTHCVVRHAPRYLTRMLPHLLTLLRWWLRIVPAARLRRARKLPSPRLSRTCPTPHASSVSRISDAGPTRDPASIVFAALAEEYRRAERFEEAIATCRAGLEHHPAFLSARVTLGRALIEVGELEESEGRVETRRERRPGEPGRHPGLGRDSQPAGELDEEKVYSAMAEFVVAEPGLHEAPHRPAIDAPAATPVPVGVAAAEPVGPPTPSDPPVVVVERGFQEAPFRPTTDAPAATPVGVAAAEPVRPPTPSLLPVVSSVDTDALRSLDGFLVAILVARAQRERASLS